MARFYIEVEMITKREEWEDPQTLPFMFDLRKLDACLSLTENTCAIWIGNGEPLQIKVEGGLNTVAKYIEQAYTKVSGGTLEGI